MKRYTMWTSHVETVMEEDSDGDWCKWEDIVAQSLTITTLHAENKDLKEKLKDALWYLNEDRAHHYRTGNHKAGDSLGKLIDKLGGEDK